MERLTLEPLSEGYAVEPGEATLSVQLAGGLGRYRLDQLNPSSFYNCTWKVGPEDYEYLAAFRRVMERRQEQFLCTLLFEKSLPEDHYCYFVKNSWQLPEQQGLEYTVTARIEAVPVALPDDAFDDALVALHTSYGTDVDFSNLFNQLEILANVSLPN